MYTTLVGIVNVVIPVVKKAFLLIRVTPEGILIAVIFLQPEQKPCGITVTLEGMVSDISWEHSAKQ